MSDNPSSPIYTNEKTYTLLQLLHKIEKNLNELEQEIEDFDISQKLMIKENQEVVGMFDSDKKLVLNLKNELSNKINNSLQTPLSTPTSLELVGINTSKEQERIKLGSNLTYDDNTKTLNASGGSEGGNYIHNIYIKNASQKTHIYFSIINNSSTPFTESTLKTYLANYNNKRFNASGVHHYEPYGASPRNQPIFALEVTFDDSNKYLKFYFVDLASDSILYYGHSNFTLNAIDNVLDDSVLMIE